MQGTRLFRASGSAVAFALLAGVSLSACITLAPATTQSPATLRVGASPASVPPATIAVPSTIPAPTLTPTPTETTAATVPPTPESTFFIDPLSEEALVASMLDPIQDVDPLAHTSGVDVGTEASDLPAFAEQGGLRRAAQTIDAHDSEVSVFDFRYQFPTAEAAAAFLEAEADALGETHAGAVESLPPVRLGDDTRYYTSHTEIFVIQDSFNYLIRVENVVAKIWIGGDPQMIDATEALDIATAAWSRMTIVFDPSEIDGFTT
jgi:hypothetical protein